MKKEGMNENEKELQNCNPAPFSFDYKLHTNTSTINHGITLVFVVIHHFSIFVIVVLSHHPEICLSSSSALITDKIM